MTEINPYGGALNGDCPWYVARREDNVIFDRLAQGEGCYVRTSHQMGKSSLVVRLIDSFRKSGISAVAIDLTAFGRVLSPAQWYNALALRVGRELHLEDEFDAFWTAHKSLAPFERFSQALQCVALPAVRGRLILFVDEMDLLRSLPFSPDEFLGAIHSTATRCDRDGLELDRLVFCLFATVAPPALWRNSERANCTLGRVSALEDFEREELFAVIDGLARCLLEKNQLSVPPGLPATKFMLGEILDRVFHWTQGQPYLTQKLGCAATRSLSDQLRWLAEITPAHCQQVVDDLCERLFTSTSAREQDCHLLWIRQKLLSGGLHPFRVFELLERVRRGTPAAFAVDDESECLISSGVVRIREGYLEMRNRIYEQVFEDRWLAIRSRAQESPTRFSFPPLPTIFTQNCSVLPEAITSGN